MSHARARAEWDALQTALLTHRPPCHDDDRFTADEPPINQIAPLCRACPIFAACDAYARRAQPTAGIWAGTRYGNRPRKEHAA